MGRHSKGIILWVWGVILSFAAWGHPVWPTSTVSVQAVEAEPAVPGASEMAKALVEGHSFLWSEADRQRLKESNQQLSEAENELRRAPSEEARQAAETKGRTAATALLDTLSRCLATIPIRLEPSSLTLPRLGPVQLPGDAGAFLFRLEGGVGETRCASAVASLSAQSGPIEVNVGLPGTTWVLVGLSAVPAMATSLQIRFRTEEGTLYTLPVEVVTPKSGRLKFAVLSDDTGKPTPAMVRLVWKMNGVDRKPPGAIEFAQQFDGQGHASGRRRANLHGKLSGHYWCIPGPVDMTVPPGEWEVVIRRGTEHVPVFDTFTVASGEMVERTYRPRRWTDMGKYGWYSGDDHIHCQVLSEQDAEQLMAWLQAEDVRLGNILKMGDINRTWFEQRGFGKPWRVRNEDYILVPGQECPRTHGELGHTISLDLTDMVRDTSKYYLYDWVFDTVHEQGGLSGFAHVNSGIFQVHRGMTLTVVKDQVDFVEVLQFAQLGTDLYYDFLNLGFEMTASAGSDVPWGGTVGEVRVYAYVGKGRFTADKWFDAVKAGHTFVTNGPMVEFRVSKALPGDTIKVTSNKGLHVWAQAWGDKAFTTPTRLEIVKQGEVIKSVAADNPDVEELEVELELEPQDGYWLAARVQATEGYAAHTTPVYIVREPLRFWKYEAVEGLLAKRRASLDEVAQIVAEATAAYQRGETASNKTKTELALQGPALLERVREARDLYDALEQTYRRERDLRH